MKDKPSAKKPIEGWVVYSVHQQRAIEPPASEEYAEALAELLNRKFGLPWFQARHEIPTEKNKP